MRCRICCGRLSPDQMRGAVGVAVDVAIETGHAPARLFAAAIVRLVELLLREGRDEQPQPFQLLRIEEAVKQFVVVVDRHELALANVAQVQARSQIHRRREFRQKVIGQVEIEIEARQVAALLLLDFVDVELREDHAAFGMIRVRQGQEAAGEHAFLADFFGLHGREFLPRHPFRQFNAHAFLDRLCCATW